MGRADPKNDLLARFQESPIPNRLSGPKALDNLAVAIDHKREWDWIRGAAVVKINQPSSSTIVISRFRRRAVNLICLLGSDEAFLVSVQDVNLFVRTDAYICDSTDACGGDGGTTENQQQ